MKKNMMKMLFALLLMLALTGSVLASEGTEITIDQIQKYGNLVLSIPGTEFLALGYSYGDLVTVSIGDADYDMPIGTSYSDVEEGSMICRVVVDPKTGDDHVILAINMGDLATTADIAVKSKIEAEPGYRWDYIGDHAPLRITFSMKEQGGYHDEFLLRQLKRTNERADYAHLTDEQFANFRMIVTSGMGDRALYRSSSPVNPELGRNGYADAALHFAKIKTIVNLADSKAGMESYAGYGETAYSACQVIGLNLGIDVMADEFQQGLAQGLRFMMHQEGPYLIHCTEGKDRAGFVSALLECLMGASLEEVTADYMITFTNYYGVQPGNEQYQAIAASNIQKTLASVFETNDLIHADLAEEAKTYLKEKLQMTPEEIRLLQKKLAASH